MDRIFKAKRLIGAATAVGLGYSANFIGSAEAQTTFYTADSTNAATSTVGLSARTLGNTTLLNPSSLAPGANQYKYAVVTFTPTSSGNFSFGQTYSPVDSVMILYAGIYNPSTPGAGGLVGNDDTSQINHQTAIGSPVTISCAGSTGLCPQITYSVVAGQTYSLFVSVYNTGYNPSFNLPFDFYSTGAVSFNPYTGRSPIDMMQPFYLASQLGVTVDPIFVGGTLKVDQASIGDNFTLANMASSTIDQNGTTSTFTGIFSDAAVGTPGRITIDNSGSGGSVTFSGANTYTGSTTLKGGTLIVTQDANLGATAATLVFDGGTLRAGGSFDSARAVTLASTGTLDVDGGRTLGLSGIVSGSGSWTKAGAGTAVLTADNPYTGLTTVAAGTLIVGDAANPTAALSGGGGVNIASGATFGGYGSVTGNIVNNGALAAGSASSSIVGGPFGAFTVAGNFSGLGQLKVNTQLDGDGSPSDLLIVSGAGNTASGTTNLIVTNVGGQGSYTVGNGILVVDAINGATTDPGAFQLGAPAVAGPYEYSLYQGARDGSNAYGWYLRNERPAEPTTPDFRREVSLYSTMASQAQSYGRLLVDTLHERSGDSDTVNVLGQPTTPYAGWGRIIAQHGSRSNGQGIYSRDGAAYEQDIYAFQAGIDLFRKDNADGSRDRAGVYGAIGHSESDVTHYTGVRAGTNDLDAYSIGAYWTHYGAQGWYTDSVAQFTRYDAEMDSKRGLNLKTDGYGFTASFEGGYTFRFVNGLILEPQAQIVYQRDQFDDASDRGAQVWFKDNDSLAGRIGLRIRKDWALDDSSTPRTLTTWARANLWQEFLGDNRISFSSADGPVAFRSDMGGTWGEIQGGATLQFANQTSLFASAGYQFGLTGDRHAYNGKVGLKFTW